MKHKISILIRKKKQSADVYFPKPYLNLKPNRFRKTMLLFDFLGEEILSNFSRTHTVSLSLSLGINLEEYRKNVRHIVLIEVQFNPVLLKACIYCYFCYFCFFWNILHLQISWEILEFIYSLPSASTRLAVYKTRDYQP